MSVKVDLLLKDELIYELKLRNVELSESSTVSDLRKILRQALIQKVPVNSENIKSTLVPQDEIEWLNRKISLMEEKALELNDSSKSIEIARQEARINHCKHRINTLGICDLSNELKKECKELCDRYTAVKNKFNELRFDRNVVEFTVRKLSETNMEEENFEEVFVKESNVTVQSLETNPVPEFSAGLSRLKIPNPIEITHTASTSSPFDPNLYSKLPNPLETHLRSVTNCDGLVTSDLVQFVKVLFKVQKQTNLSDEQIIEIFVTKTQSPLLDIMLSHKDKSLEYLKQVILQNFVPISVREDLIRQFVTRHQESNEPLPLYISRVKEYSKILNCVYTEPEIVELLIIGLNPKCRVNLSLVRNITTIADLEKACLHSLSVDIKNNLRNREERGNPVERGVNVNSKSQGDRVCFSCGRPGHIAKHCFRRNPKN